MSVWRVWLGWRAPQLRGAGGWQRFVDDLGRTFLPATWLVMRRYGLRCYAPSVLAADLATQPPEETALLLYASEADYQGHKRTVGGRAYGQMHGALFSFERDATLSRSAWAVPWPQSPPPDAKVRAWWWPGDDAALTLDAAQSQLVFALVAHAEPPSVPPEALRAALNCPEGQAIVCIDGKHTLAWVATRGDRDAAALAQGLAAVLPQASVLAAHRARPISLQLDYFGDQGGEVPVRSDESLRFL